MELEKQHLIHQQDEGRKRRRICVITGSRAEYGLLAPVMKEILHGEGKDLFELKVIVTGSHLSREFGNTSKLIEQDGFEINWKVDMLLSSDTDVAIAKSMGLGMIGFSEAFAQLSPDLVVVLGDRFEILAAVSTALVMRLPVAHLCGGDITEGAFDESARHSITKMSHLHFPSCLESAVRVRQMGENPSRIFPVGNPGLSDLPGMMKTPGRSFEEVLHSLLFSTTSPSSLSSTLCSCPTNLLVIFHPVTLSTTTTTTTSSSSLHQFQQLLAALDVLLEEEGVGHIVFIHPNADNERGGIHAALQDWISTRQRLVTSSSSSSSSSSSRSVTLPSVTSFSSLPRLDFLELLRSSSLLIGNSSAGVYEAPLLGIPTINIGNRQRGRSKGPSVVDCEPISAEILNAIKSTQGMKVHPNQSPYHPEALISPEERGRRRGREGEGEGEGEVAEKRIVRILSEFQDFKQLLVKPFFHQPLTHPHSHK